MSGTVKKGTVGKTTVVLYGNRRTCSACRALDAITGKGALARLLPGTDIVDADASNIAMVKAWRPKLARVTAIPVVAVFDAVGKRVAQFVCRRSSSSGAEKWAAVRPWSAKGLADRIAGTCSDCCLGDDCTDTPAKVCPTCGQVVQK
jgi:hypothetical protein